MTLPTALPFGLREVVLYPIDNTGAVGTGVPLPNSMTFSFSDTESFAELRAGDHLVAEHGDGPVVEWKLEAGGISFEAYIIMAGGTLTSAGTTPAQKKTFKKNNTDSRPYFCVAGRAISDSGGDVKGLVFRCKADGALEGEFGQGAFFLTNASGKGFGDASTGELYDFIQSETAAAISTTWPPT